MQIWKVSFSRIFLSRDNIDWKFGSRMGYTKKLASWEPELEAHGAWRIASIICFSE